MLASVERAPYSVAKNTFSNMKDFVNDPVAISFWIISITMVAATVFLLKGSRTVCYSYMCEPWVQIGTSSVVYRYSD